MSLRRSRCPPIRRSRRPGQVAPIALLDRNGEDLTPRLEQGTGSRGREGRIGETLAHVFPVRQCPGQVAPHVDDELLVGPGRGIEQVEVSPLLVDQDTAARVLPYYEAEIWPQVKAGRNVLVAAHGNSLRALIMRLERLSGEEIVARELATGVPIVYRLAPDGTVMERMALVPSSAT